MPNEHQHDEPGEICAHCIHVAHGLGAVGDLLDADTHHYLLAAVMNARAEGHAARDCVELLAFLFSLPELAPDAPARPAADAPPPRVGVSFGRGERGV